MSQPMNSFEQTRIWRSSLAEQGGNELDAEPRERLRTVYLRFREQASTLAREIDTGLKNLTVHDVTHIDALWGIADLLTEDDFTLTPLEAFLLGGAFLLHDLGLALAAYPRGIVEVREESRWKDSVSWMLRSRLHRAPRAEEIQNAPPEVAERATDETLRYLHAQKAKVLGTLSFQHKRRDPEFYLVEDPELRSTYGELIGRIAASHWEPVDSAAAEFNCRLGALPGFPPEWTIDPLMLAALLRACDACHLDARRAPGLLRALKKPFGTAELHWRFQEYVQTLRVEHNLVHFTATRPFPLEDRDAWWIGYELVRQADRELRDVDAVLRETGRRPMTAHGVANAETPLRLCRVLPTAGWTPMDAALRVGDVARMASILGGERFYGRNPWVPLRELVQNARDAVVARRILERRDYTWGHIVVRVVSVSNNYWLEVEDTGIGMSEQLLAGPLLDFGQTYWGSDLCMAEWPGLLSSPFDPVGKYGIGFFSVFMLGEAVKVTTRRPQDGKGDTRVLEFAAGLATRPVLRKATQDEQRNDPGTLVRIKLTTKPESRGGFLGPSNIEVWPFQHVARRSPWSLRDLCEWLCPALDVDLLTEEGGSQQTAIRANDWRTIEPELLCNRTMLHLEDRAAVLSLPYVQSLLANIRPIEDDSGEVITRACWWPDFGADLIPCTPLETDGGFRGGPSRSGLGLWIGRSQVATRYSVKPVALDYPKHLSPWATGQARLLAKMNLPFLAQVSAAGMIRAVGADTGPLPIVIGRSGLLAFEDIYRNMVLPQQVVLFEAHVIGEWWTYFEKTFGPPESNRLIPGALGVLGERMQASFHTFGADDLEHRAHHPAWRSYWASCWGATMEAVARAWGVSLQRMLEASDISTIRQKFGAVIGTDADGKEVWNDHVDVLRRPA